MPGPSPFRDRWLLDPAVTFLNHGSFGACPRAVLVEQGRLRERMERQPVRFFVRDVPGLLDAARCALATFIGADPGELAFVPNATAGVNAVLRSLHLAPGDELLTTDHAYAACRNAVAYAARRADARLVVASVPFPLAGDEAVVEAVLAAVTARTRLVLLDHVTSPTGVVFPVAALAQALAARGVDVLIDGAHAPGMLPVAVGRLGVAYYTGNCHKWLCAPKGAGFLFVRRDRQEGVHPLAISHGLTAPLGERSRFHLEFDWVGTSDPTPFLCVPEAIAYMGALLPGGWDELRAHNRTLALEARAILCAALGVPAPCPDAMVGSLAAVPLPDASAITTPWAFTIDPLQDALLDRFGIEVPVVSWPRAPRRLLRVSAQLYNSRDDYVRLAAALRALL